MSIQNSPILKILHVLFVEKFYIKGTFVSHLNFAFTFNKMLFGCCIQSAFIKYVFILHLNIVFGIMKRM